jgi:hypothetical protein
MQELIEIKTTVYTTADILPHNHDPSEALGLIEGII